MTGHRMQSSSAYRPSPRTTEELWDAGQRRMVPERQEDGKDDPRICAVCREEASGMYFGALVCLPCKSFFIRSTKDGLPRFTCLVNGHCDVTHGNRLRCQYCRFQKCLKVGMCRKEKPEIIQPAEGQVLCRVCHDIANGVHFGVPTCEGCKKFFRRALKESTTYFCKFERACAMNPRNRNSCRFCRYQTCIHVGMSRNAIRMGRPKKMSSKEFRHMCGNQSYKMGTFSDWNVNPHHTSVIKRHVPYRTGLNKQPADHLTPSPGHRGKDVEGGPTGCNASLAVTSGSPPMLSSQGLRAPLTERSVIRSCGNPADSPLTFTGRLHASGYRTVLSHSSSVSSSGSSVGEATSSGSDYGGYDSPGNRSHNSGSPHSDMSVSFHSVDSADGSTGVGGAEDKDSLLMDIEEDLTDILSALSQYNPPPVSASVQQHQQPPSHPQPHHSDRLSHTSTLAPISTFSQMLATDHMNNFLPRHYTDDQACHEQHRAYLDNGSLKPEQEGFATNCQIGMPPSSSPAQSVNNTVWVKEETHDAMTKEGVGRPSESSHGAPTSDVVGHEREGVSAASNLFSQMYNSLLLTYNVGNIGAGSMDEGRYPSSVGGLSGSSLNLVANSTYV